MACALLCLRIAPVKVRMNDYTLKQMKHTTDCIVIVVKNYNHVCFGSKAQHVCTRHICTEGALYRVPLFGQEWLINKNRRWAYIVGRCILVPGNNFIIIILRLHRVHISGYYGLQAHTRAMLMLRILKGAIEPIISVCNNL